MNARCAICNTPFTVSTQRRKTCSSACAHENKRRMRKEKQRRREKRKAHAARLGKRCRTCDVDISWRFGAARYCSQQCWKVADLAKRRDEYARAHIPRARFCSKCSEPISSRRHLCDGCRKPCESGWSTWNEARRALPRERQMELKERQKQSHERMKKRIRAANELYRELMGHAPKPAHQQLLLPPPLCVVCGIFITGSRKRVLCSKACAEARARERSSCRYYGDPLPATPRMMATREWTADRGAKKFRNHRRRQYTPWTEPWTERRRNARRASERHHTAVYAAMRELNLIEGEDGL